MFFTTTAVNSVSTIAAESSDISSSAEMDDLSNDKEYIEVDYYKTNKNERYSVKYPIKIYNNGNDTQLVIT